MQALIRRHRFMWRLIWAAQFAHDPYTSFEVSEQATLYTVCPTLSKRNGRCFDVGSMLILYCVFIGPSGLCLTVYEYVQVRISTVAGGTCFE